MRFEEPRGGPGRMKGAMGDHDSVLALRVTSTGCCCPFHFAAPWPGLISGTAADWKGNSVAVENQPLGRQQPDLLGRCLGTQSVRLGGRSSQDLYLAARVPEAVYQLRIAQ